MVAEAVRKSPPGSVGVGKNVRTETDPTRASPTTLSPWSFFAALFVVALALNWAWEMVEMPGYAQMAGRPWPETVLLCARAALGDVAMTFAICGLGALATRQPRWSLSGRWNVYVTTALLGAGLATAYEWYSLATGRWSYTSLMPIVPLRHVGLWAVLQLAILVPASLWIAFRWARQKQVLAEGTSRHIQALDSSRRA